MEKIKKRIANLKVAGKLKVYRMTVLVMTLFLVFVALISTLVIRSNIKKITEVWSPSLEYLQDLETMTAKYRIKQYQHLVESDAAVMNSCEEEIQKLESQIKDTGVNLNALITADSDAQKGKADYEVANTGWEKYRAASDEILKLSREGKQQEASKLMTGEVYEEYKAFAEKLTKLRDEFQVELDRAKTMANICTVIIFIVIVAAGLAIAVVTTLIGRIITNSITEPVEQIDAAVASLRKGELSNVEMLTYESEDELGDTIRNLKEAMGILADYVSEISVEVKAIAQGNLTRNGDDITDFLGDFSELKTSLLYILKRFNSTLTEISNLAEQVSSNSSEVEKASKSLADGATEQAGVIEELNATIDTVVDLSADTAKETQSASARVKASANKANEEKEKMNDLLMEMEHITEISKEIGNIITDIEDIASQTNLLSLNASNSEQIKPKETSCLSAENQGIKLTASEVYCDGFSVYVTMQMQSEQIDFSKETKRICVKTRYGFQKQITQEDSDILIDGKCVDKHTFIGMMKFDKTDVIKEDGKLSIQILTIYFQEESLSGRWDFEIPYTVYEEGSREIAVNKKLSSHLMIKNVFISPYQIVVFTKETGGVHSQIALFDQNGKKISFEEIGDKEGRWERKLYARNGRVITKLYGYVTTEDSIALYKAKTRKEAKRLSTYQFSVDVL